MLSEKEMHTAWANLAALIASLPREDQANFHESIKQLIHDLRQCLAIYHSAEALLRQTVPNTPENLELLDSIQTANRSALSILTDFALPFDRPQISQPEDGQSKGAAWA